METVGHETDDGRIYVVGAAIVRDGMLLAARRVEPESLAGGWELPGGKVEPGESHGEALVREVAEELHVAVTLSEEIGDGWPLGDRYWMRVWLAHLDGDAEPVAGEQHDQIAWVDLSNFESLAWLPGDVAPARAALEASGGMDKGTPPPR